MEAAFLAALVTLFAPLNVFAPPLTTPEPQAQLAAAPKSVTGKDECTFGELKFNGGDSVGEQKCVRGAEYEVTAPKPGNLMYAIRTMKCPSPPPSPHPANVSAQQWKKQWEEKQPEGIVRFKTPTAGTIVSICKSTFKSSTALMSEIKAISSQPSGISPGSPTPTLDNPLQPTAPPGNLGSPTLMSSPLPQSDAIADALRLAGSPEPANAGKEPPLQTTPVDVTREIAATRNYLNDNDSDIQKAAQLYAAMPTRLGEEYYLGVDTGKAGNTLGDSLGQQVYSASERNTYTAIADTFSDGGSKYEVGLATNGATTRVTDTETDASTYYSNVTGQPFMEKRDGSLSLISSEGDRYPVVAGGDWKNNLVSMDKAEYDAFAAQYLSPSGQPVQSYRFESVTDAMEDYPSGRVTVTDTEGNKTILSGEEYGAVVDAGTRIYDTKQLAREMSLWTHGKMVPDSPGAFPTAGGLFAEDGKLPASMLTPLSVGQYTDSMQKMFDVYKQIPTEVWANPAVRETDVYVFAPDPERGTTDIMGRAGLGGGAQWANPTNQYDFYQVASHELGHSLFGVFPTTQEWGSAVYGAQWTSSYGGAGAVEAVMEGKFGFGRPADFATQYAWAGGPLEDQAEVFGAMLTNYPAVRDAAAHDIVLASKMALVQDSFATASNGVMDQNYWNNLRVLDRNYFLQPPTRNFLQRVSDALRASR